MTAPSSIPRLAAMVLKTGVALGQLTHVDRVLALAVAARCLADGVAASEAQVNALLQRCLAEEAGFLDTDHVELRRWLVDTGWWQRDGYGRAYERTPQAALPPELRAVATDLAGLDLPAWIAQRRGVQQAEREARRAAWDARQQGASNG